MAELLRLIPQEADRDQIQVRVDAHMLRVSGELDLNTAAHLWTSLSFAFDPDQPIRVDMSEVTFIDSSALQSLMKTSAERTVVIVNPSPQVCRLLSVTGLAGHFGLTLDEVG